MTYIYKILHSKPLLWFLLAIPSVPFLKDFIWPTLYEPEMLYRTGVISTQLLILTLCITPIVQILKRYVIGREINRWLLHRRRNFGVASFTYAVIHLLIYVRQNSDLQILWDEAITWEYGSGWIAFFVMMPLALSSNNFSMKLMGKSWKSLQQWAYFVAVATFFHWISFGAFVDPAIQWLLVLLVFRTLYIWQKMKPKPSVQS